MDATYGYDPVFERRLEDYSASSCCGDEILGRALFQGSVDQRIRLKSPDPATESGFSGSTPFQLQLTEATWCDPIYTLHHLSPKLVEELWRFEQDIWPKLAPGDTIRFVDIFLRFRHSFMEAGQVEVTRAVWDNASNDVTVSADDSRSCSLQCDKAGDCWAWRWKDGECFLALSKITIGDYNEEASTSVISGIRMDRLEAFRATQRCEDRPMLSTR